LLPGCPDDACRRRYPRAPDRERTLATFFQRMLAAGKPLKVILVVARKLAGYPYDVIRT
jgi:hypothetical protein